jgi:DNA-binding MarR family transcriptional regulator
MSPRDDSAPRRGGTRAQQSVRLWLRLLSLHNLVEGHVRRRLQEGYGCTLPQFDVLSELDFAGEPQTMSQVSRRLMVSNGNLTGVVDRLVKEGLVRREVAAHDRRAQLLSLSEAGAARFRAMASEHAGWLQELFGELPREALDDAVGGMHALRNVVRARLDTAESTPAARKRRRKTEDTST